MRQKNYWVIFVFIMLGIAKLGLFGFSCELDEDGLIRKGLGLVRFCYDVA